PWELTPKQYAEARIRCMRQEYPDVPLEEIREVYPEEILIDEYYQNWDRWVHKTGQQGIRIPNKVLDRVTERARYRATHDYPDLYRDYMPPEVRKMNREQPRIYSRKRAR